MRKLVSIFIFSAALFVGVFFLPVDTPTIYEKIYPDFSQDEMNLLIGKKVSNKADTGQWLGRKYSLDIEFNPRGRKYPLDDKDNMIADVLQDGEKGTVVDLQAVLKDKSVFLQKVMKNCGLLVQWDAKNKDGRDMFSCNRRFTSRAFLEFK